MASADSSFSVLADGLVFGEGPRWYDGGVYLSDIHDDAIKRVELDGTVSVAASLPGSPISVGFTDSGSMLVSALIDQAIWAVGDDGKVSVLHALSSVSEYGFGDIVIDNLGRIYIANRGFDFVKGIPNKVDAAVYRIELDGSVTEVASGFEYPNGLAILPDEQTLVVAETFAHRIVTLPIHDDGSLGERTELVSFAAGAARPDGICTDADGGVWSANAHGKEVVRVAADGTVTHRLSTGDDMAIGCILGGPDGHDLFVTTATTAYRDQARESKSSRVLTAKVDVARGGRP